MARIFVKNFGPIKEINFTIGGGFTVIIGEQATGKSTLAKCIYFFKDIVSVLGHNLLRRPARNKNRQVEEVLEEFYAEVIEEFSICFGKNILKKDSIIHYWYDTGKSASITADDGKLRVKFDDKTKMEVAGVIGAYLDCLQQGDEGKTLFGKLYYFSDQIRELFGESARSMFIPACRSRVTDSLGMNVPFSSRQRVADFYLNKMLSYIEYYQFFFETYEEYDFIRNCELMNVVAADKHGRFLKMEELKRTILKGQYSFSSEKNESFIVIENEEIIPIKYVSSGQQEALWILNLLTMIMLEARKSFLIVEEPEAHLYPSAQLALVELISLVVNTTGSKILVTTHSPYILSSFNLLTVAGEVEEDDESGIIDACVRVKPADIGAYKIVNGKCEDIYDHDESMILSEEIDSVSECINDSFDKLLMKKYSEDEQ